MSNLRIGPRAKENLNGENEMKLFRVERCILITEFIEKKGHQMILNPLPLPNLK